jgi:NADH-quinone oxidoreductase subunit N
MMLDFTNQSDYFRALLPEIVLSLWAMLVLLVDVFQKGNRSEPSRPIIPWLALAGLVATAVANGWLLGLTDSAATGVVAVDGFRVFANFIFLIAAAMAILLSIGYLDRKGINLGEYYVLIMFATVGMMILAASRDLILLFLGLELMSVSIYVLVGINRRDPRSAEGAAEVLPAGRVRERLPAVRDRADLREHRDDESQSRSRCR